MGDQHPDTAPKSLSRFAKLSVRPHVGAAASVGMIVHPFVCPDVLNVPWKRRFATAAPAPDGYTNRPPWFVWSPPGPHSVPLVENMPGP